MSSAGGGLWEGVPLPEGALSFEVPSIAVSSRSSLPGFAADGELGGADVLLWICSIEEAAAALRLPGEGSASSVVSSRALTCWLAR